MTDIAHDQAEGLRRLMSHDSTRFVSIASGSTGAGKTITVINIAAFLVSMGKSVLVIDENIGASNICGTLGLRAHRDLLDVIRRDKSLDQVLFSAKEGFRILPAGRGTRVLGQLNPGDQAHLIGSFAHLSDALDVVLIDTVPGRSSKLLSLDFVGHELLIVLLPEPTSITAAYSVIKHIHGIQPDKKHFPILINKTSMDREAKMIFDNMASAASRYLGVSLNCMGFIPSDIKLCLGRPVAEALPAAPSAAAFCGIAKSLAGWPCQEGESRSLERFIQRLLQNNSAGPDHRSSPAAAGSR